ncbi:hypothetical protein SAMN05216344_110120 [Polaromonas sp. OV174]|uniref:hypothetical protein n=1 Tax=Polaromonas sp. OV174 TaxID=1855300 RepID=UPI0008E446A5|nr:hypothetical protein [Polaromonas sp. OV174]SFC17489.1 hypothetical protein SAMN05216344_110120 [Polaromonas sp. OV174]
MLDLTVVLMVVAALGLMFSSTRQLGILSMAVLCFLYPVPVIAVLLIAGGIVIFNRYR